MCRGKHTRASPQNYSPCSEKTGACYTGYWAGCPIYLSLVVWFEWIVMNPHWGCLETGWGQINPGGVVCLSSVSRIIEREQWAHSGLYQLQWCLCHLLGSKGQGQKSNFMCDGPNAISAKHSAYEQAVPLGEWWEVTQSNKRKDTPLAACSACPNRRAFSHARKTEKRRFCSWAWSSSHVMIQT